MGGKKGDGVEIRGDAMRIAFTFEGKRYRPMLKVGDVPMKPTAPNQKYARRLVEEIRTKIKAGAFVMGEYFPELAQAPTAMTVKEQLTAWLGTVTGAPNTIKSYKNAAAFWQGAAYQEGGTGAFGDIPLKLVKPSHVKTAIAIRQDLAPATQSLYLFVLRSAIGLAVLDKQLEENPATHAEPAKKRVRLPDPFSAAERDAIVSRAAEMFPGHVANMVQFWMWAGPRTGEVLGLQWDCVNLVRKEVLIARQITQGGPRERTKTGRERIINLNKVALEALERQQALTLQHPSGYVFLDPRYNAPWEPDCFHSTLWRQIIKALGIRYRRPYQMRHTYATTMLMAGLNAAFCAEQLGHSVEMFLKVYSKWIHGQANTQQIARLEATIAPTVPQITGPR